MVRTHRATQDGTGRRIALIRSRYNDEITRRLQDGAVAALAEQGVADGDLVVVEVPGAVELALAAKLVIERHDVDAVVCLGAVIQGETDHYEHVSRVAADSVARVAIETGIPVTFGVLTCSCLEHALARSRRDDANKGREAALTALEMANLAVLLAPRQHPAGFVKKAGHAGHAKS